MTKTAHQRGYGHQWQRARLAYLDENPLCAYCSRLGRTTPATVVDHVIPHKGDRDLFWDQSNWQPLCKTHHDSHKKLVEARGKAALGWDIYGQRIGVGA